MKKSVLFLIPIFLFGMCTKKEKNDLIIASAANLYPVLPEIIDSFEEQFPYKVHAIYRSSGMLYASINEGATYDVFLSANENAPNRLFQAKIGSKPCIFAYGNMMIFAFKDSNLLDFKSWATNKKIKIAIANPKSAPFGETTLKFLKNHEIFSQIENQIVYGENIQQVNQFVSSGAADVGITSTSIKNAISNGFFETVHSSLNAELTQSAQTIKPHKKGGNLFVKFLESKTVKDILSKNGYNCKP